MPKLNKIKETCLYVEDLHRTKDFYHVILGLPLIVLKEGRHVFFRAGEDVLLCFLPDSTRNETGLPPHYASGHQHFAFECDADQYEEWKSFLKDHNVGIEQEVDWGKGIRSFYFRDPDQHCVEILMKGLWD